MSFVGGFFQMSVPGPAEREKADIVVDKGCGMYVGKRRLSLGIDLMEDLCACERGGEIIYSFVM